METNGIKQPVQHITTGIPIKKDACVIIIKTEWNSAITNALEASCIVILEQQGIQDIQQYTVPGAVEIPFAVKTIAAATQKNIDAFVVFGCVIKGGTPHFDYVCKIVSEGILHLQLQLTMPIIFGILTVDYEAQAMDRIKGGRVGDKGEEAAITALKMIAFKQQIG
jgi:6,7-dimethyl-8-ribityllumazine synthase